jgi:hypothetical protein
MSPAKVRYKLPNLRNTPSSSRPVDEEEESEDELSSSRKGFGLTRAEKGKGREEGKGRGRRDGKLPFKALPTPVKSSQMVGEGREVFGMCEDLV